MEFFVVAGIKNQAPSSFSQRSSLIKAYILENDISLDIMKQTTLVCKGWCEVLVELYSFGGKYSHPCITLFCN